MSLDAQSTPALLAATAAGACVLGFGLHRFGDAELRSWAVPSAVAVFCGGVGYAFYLPPVVTIAAFLGALYFFHRSVRQRQEKAAAAIAAVSTPNDGPSFQKVRKPPEGFLGLWREAPKMTGAADAAQREPMTLSVKFVGENDDEYQVVASARVDRFITGVLFIRHEACDKKFASTLSDQPALSGLEGQPANLVFKAMPADYVFGVLNLSMVAHLSELFELRGGEREIVLHASGPEVRIVSNRLLEEKELTQALSKIALLADKIRDLGGQERLF
jgi:hypothetical protein